jgi:hypothetical protein
MIRITITVANVAEAIALYTHIRLYSSEEEDGTYTHLAYVLLVSGVSTYTYDHLAGTLDTWYKCSYYNTSPSRESDQSDAAQGRRAELFYSPTYPPEFIFDNSELDIIRKIRRFIGDFKGLKRLYIDEAEFCNYIQDDNKTVDMSEKSWPVYVSLNDTEKTSLLEPVVQGYQYLTFSGTLDESSDTLDIWYYTFKFSDVEVYEAFEDTLIPPGLTSSTVTQDHLVLQASIDLLENMTSEDMVENGAAVRDDRSLYDPSPGLRERAVTIERLKKLLHSLVKQYMFSDLTGMLID